MAVYGDTEGRLDDPELAHPVQERSEDELDDQVLTDSETWLRPRH